MINRLRETWNTGKPALNGWLAIPSTFSAEIMSHQNFDSITIDLQHGLTDYSIAVPSYQTSHVQELHIIVLHLLCILIEKNI